MSRILDRTVRRLGATATATADGWEFGFLSSVDAFARNNKGDLDLLRKIQPAHDGVRLWDETGRGLTGDDALLFFLGGKPAGWAELADIPGQPATRPRTDGIYLKNYGVVFSVTAP